MLMFLFLNTTAFLVGTEKHNLAQCPMDTMDTQQNYNVLQIHDQQIWLKTWKIPIV